MRGLALSHGRFEPIGARECCTCLIFPLPRRTAPRCRAACNGKQGPSALYPFISFVLQMGCAGTDREQACLIDVSLLVLLVTGGAWALLHAKLVLPCLVCPLTRRNIHRLSTQMERTAPPKQDRRPARPTNCAETRESGSGITKNESAAGFFSHRGLLHWQFFATRCLLHGPAPLVSLTASDGRFFFFSRRTNFSFFFLMGEGEGPKRERPTQSCWVR